MTKRNEQFEFDRAVTEANRAAQSEFDQTMYRGKCRRRRRGKIIEEANGPGGSWVQVATYPSVNAAKRNNRGTAGRSYAE